MKKKKNKPGGGTATKLPANMLFTTYEITYDPLPDEAYLRLPEDVKSEFTRLYLLIEKDPWAAIEELPRWIEQYNMPVLYNYLGNAYARAGRLQKANQVIAECYLKFPDYLFARLNYAGLFLNSGNFERMEEILDHKFELSLLCPGRTKFHITEAIAYASLMGHYFARMGNFHQAEIYYSMLKQLAPDDRSTALLHKEIYFQEYY